MENDEIMLKVENVSKVYKLGEIGGTTLRDELQRAKAKLLKREDPTKKIGAKDYNKGEKFKALDNIDFEVKKGERIGIIGHNGAGKSTLLKLISRVTGPTEGSIYMNGRVASMLEVGTGFHPELTGRENIYMNGAILGMTKKEIDAKMEEIIEFSEVRQFIDTPVKRYSSGMYVKLAFSVAAHLDSEIMIMDEVLAVGDTAFQNKCLKKMKEVSEENSRTILYVSHNMNTIRQLCNRVIVLKRGNIIFNGDVEEGIAKYTGELDGEQLPVVYNFKDEQRKFNFGDIAKIENVSLLNKEKAIFKNDEELLLSFVIDSKAEIPNARIFMSFQNDLGLKLGTAVSKNIEVKNGKNRFSLAYNLDELSYGFYSVQVSLVSINSDETTFSFDVPPSYIFLKIVDNYSYGFKWTHKYEGYIRFGELIKRDSVDE